MGVATRATTRASNSRNRSVSGYCAPSAGELGGDCSAGDSGSWSLGRNRIRSLQACVARCRQCARCAFVSYSAAPVHSECSWYSDCDLDDLRPPPHTGPDYVTVRVKAASEREPARLALGSPARSVRVAIVTLLVGPRWQPSMGQETIYQQEQMMKPCGVVQWCHEARRYAEAINELPGFNASVYVVARRHRNRDGALEDASFDARDCPGATLVATDWRVEKAMRRCAELPRSGASSRRHVPLLWTGHPSLLKWSVVGWTQFDWVAFTDVDVMLMPVEVEARDVTARWAQMAGGAAGGAAGGGGGGAIDRVRFISSADHSAPVNAGIWLVRPSSDDFDAGVAVLGRCRFNSTHGWEFAGPPRALGLRPIHPDGASICDGRADGTCLDPAPKTDLGDDPVSCDAYRQNTYETESFVGSTIDQGFFWFMFYVRAPVGAYFRYHTNKHKAMHWYGAGKPWARFTAAGVARASRWEFGYAYSFLMRATALTHANRTGAGSECTQELWRVRRAIESDPRIKRYEFGRLPPYFPIW